MPLHQGLYVDLSSFCIRHKETDRRQIIKGTLLLSEEMSDDDSALAAPPPPPGYITNAPVIFGVPEQDQLHLRPTTMISPAVVATRLTSQQDQPRIAVLSCPPAIAANHPSHCISAPPSHNPAISSSSPTQMATLSQGPITTTTGIVIPQQLFHFPRHSVGLQSVIGGSSSSSSSQQQKQHQQQPYYQSTATSHHQVSSSSSSNVNHSFGGSTTATGNIAIGPPVLAPRQKTHLRKAAAEVWSDPTLDEWGDDDFRARVIRDKRTGKGRGYGFASFSDPQDMLRALQEMDRKYVGNRPIRVMKSRWKEREVGSVQNKRVNDSSITAPSGSKTLKKFKIMKPVTGGKKAMSTVTAPPPGVSASSSSSTLGGPPNHHHHHRNFRGAPTAYNYMNPSRMGRSAD